MSEKLIQYPYFPIARNILTLRATCKRRHKHMQLTMLVLLSLACSLPSVNVRYPYVGSHAINDLVNISHIWSMMRDVFLFHDNLTYFFFLGFYLPLFFLSQAHCASDGHATLQRRRSGGHGSSRGVDGWWGWRRSCVSRRWVRFNLTRLNNIFTPSLTLFFFHDKCPTCMGWGATALLHLQFCLDSNLSI